VGWSGWGSSWSPGGAVVPDGAGGLFLGRARAGALGYWMLTEAMRAGEISVITPFRYSRSSSRWAIGIASSASGPTLDALGAALIVGSGSTASCARGRAPAPRPFHRAAAAVDGHDFLTCS
jgi:hypothetical protein